MPRTRNVLQAVAILTLATLVAQAADRLYLKDGDYQLVREYQVQKDRVRYYSTERGDWEEIPLELVDLDRTKKEAADQKAELEADVKAQAEEDAAIKAARAEVASVPTENGAYYIRNGKPVAIKQGESKLVMDKRRTVLKYLSPVPLVPGKGTVELEGETASLQVEGRRPEFYFRPSDYESIAIVKMGPKKGVRVLEKASILAVQGERIINEERDEVKTFKKQEGDLFYKMWPEKPLEPGEYAIVQFTDGKLNPQVWDFSVK
jgi:ASC-1-like (ASCH) protein